MPSQIRDGKFRCGNFAEPRGFCVVNFIVVNFAGNPKNVDVPKMLMCVELTHR